ncbi:GNAT family N-acetyltransferase [Neisseriaceae bacterium TC5R-5]|nr:GNAT family N-acetyltransferase [Neisseriaceae bacterium TC5R-5]
MLLPLQVNDLAACHALFLESIHALAGHCYSTQQCAAWAGDPWGRALAQTWEIRLKNAWGTKWLASDGVLAGFACLSHEGVFDMLYVAPWAQRQGGAGRMLCLLEQQAAQVGVVALHAWASHASRPVFERAGYQYLRTNSVRRHGVVLENYLLAKGGWQESRSLDQATSKQEIL